jgi:hypothetical protein
MSDLFMNKSSDDWNKLKHLVDLSAENARLKAEVGELADALKLASEVGIKIADEVTRLKAEVERLKAYNEEALAHIAKEERKSRECLDMEQAENARLKAEVERLRKAGDDLIVALDKRDDCFDNSDKRQAIVNWLAAKEGKGQP